MEGASKKEDVNGEATAAKDVTTTPTMLVAGEDDHDEYTPDEIMKLVESSSPTTKIEGANFSGESSFRVRFIDDPYAIPVVVQSSSGYITINVNEESCGPSFSDSNASAMASVDASGLFGCCFDINGEKGGAWSTSEVGASECEWDDDLLARFLGEDCV
ncbi:unnamed protein product [Thlaspi arvense]|uniref:Uncharacterized protein n=1 Tax=Thlaspi arvense TaxID=13288 RepID=A0AAU9SJR4_THLAR|nr:unnamed protein product [Thlaspi arvense]